MTIQLLIVWLVTVLSTSTLAKLDREKIDIAHHAYNGAIEQGIDPKKFVKLIECESRFEKNAKGDWRSEENRYLSFGALQFQKPTFDKFSKIYRVQGKHLDPYAQIDLATQMIGNDGWEHWFNCGKKVGYTDSKF